MSYRNHASLGAALPTRAVTAEERTAIQTKLDRTLAKYRAMTASIQRLVSGVPFSAAQYEQAKRAALSSGPGAALRLGREQVAALLAGTFIKVENLLVRVRPVAAVAYDARTLSVINTALDAARRAMDNMARMESALQRATTATSGLGQITGDSAAGVAVAVGLLLAPLTGGVSLLLVAGGAAYLLAQSGSEIDAAAAEVDRIAQGMRSYCEGRGDMGPCMSEYERATQIATQSQAQLALAQAEADRIRRATEGPLERLLRPVSGPIGYAVGFVIVAGAAAAGGYLLYLTWPLLSGARRASRGLVGNRRHRRRRAQRRTR